MNAECWSVPTVQLRNWLKWKSPKLLPLRVKLMAFGLTTREIKHCWWSLLSLSLSVFGTIAVIHDDVIKWKHFPRYWPFVRGIHRSPVNFPHKGQWHGALMFSLICVWINDWVNNRQVGDSRCYRVHYDVIVMHFGFGNHIPHYACDIIQVSQCDLVALSKCHELLYLGGHLNDVIWSEYINKWLREISQKKLVWLSRQ